MPKEYNFTEIERKWQQKWEEMGIYHYDWNDKQREPFSIDTPPPYPSGELHMGNVLNWTYFDMVARFKRMQGFNVLFPQGWDCHGLGIEIQVEKAKNIRKRDVPPDQFRAWCIELVEKYIAMMKEGILKMGASIDWTTEYKTMGPDYWRRTQLSFILLHKKDYMYQGTHPVNWCPQRRNRHRRRGSGPHKKRRHPPLHTLPTGRKQRIPLNRHFTPRIYPSMRRCRS